MYQNKVSCLRRPEHEVKERRNYLIAQVLILSLPKRLYECVSRFGMPLQESSVTPLGHTQTV